MSRTELGVVGRSWTWFRDAPLLALGHGCLIVVGACAVPFGVGVMVLPRTLGGLAAHQLGLEGTQRPSGMSWRAGALLFAPTLLLFAMLSLLVQVSVLSDPARFGLAPLESSWAELLWRAPLFGLAAALTGALTAPFAFASCWHIEHRSSLREALLASLAVSHTLGGARAWGWTTLAAALPTAGGCALLAFSSRLGPGGDQVLVFAAALLWLMSIVVARGCLTACYVAQRPEPPRPELESFPRVLSLALGGVAVLMGGLMLTCVALARPSPLGPGGLPDDAAVEFRVRAGERTFVEPLTAAGLAFELSRAGVAIIARDGGGVGLLPLPLGTRVRGARVARTGPRTFRADIHTDRGRFGVDFDAEGVRTDDALRDRMEAALAPAWQLALAICVLGTGWALARVAARPLDRGRGRRLAGWVYLPALAAVVLGCAALLRWRAFL